MRMMIRMTLFKLTPWFCFILIWTSALAQTPSGKPTLHACVLSQTECRPAYGIQMTYRWEAEPISSDTRVYVHIVAADGKLVFQDDHELPLPATRWRLPELRWSGHVEYEHTLLVPPDLAPGDYKIIAGLWNSKTNERLPITAGEGVTPMDEAAFQVGSFKVSADAPVAALPPPTLNLEDWHVTFDEDFTKKLDVSAWGPGTRWIAHTPFNLDFGDAHFTDPVKGFPFTTQDGILRIEARKTDGQWRAGLLASVDRKGDGFAQKYGYFEMRAKLPPGAGVWPAFWLMGVPAHKDKSLTQIEIDVLEQFGARPNAMVSSVHLWNYPKNIHISEANSALVPGMTTDFHRYGVLVQEDVMIFYCDGSEVLRMKTPEEAKVPLYLMVDLTIGAGWPIEKTPNPSVLEVDYVRVYAK
jgi:beta-glucanase (GH16 family)